MDPWVQAAITIIGAVMASSGFWACLKQNSKYKDAQTEMLIGLGHDRITNLCLTYLDRGDWITNDEYENLRYLYEPYVKLKGNHAAKRLMAEVDKRLKIIPAKYQNGEETEQV